MSQVDFAVIIPRMREAIKDYVIRKAAQGKTLTEREATVKWLDRYYESWLSAQIGSASSTGSAAKTEESRRARRVPIEISAYYRVLWSPEGEKDSGKGGISEVAKVENISAGGLYIVTGRSYPISTLMEIQFELFELPGISNSISAFSMVVWCRDAGIGRHGHGLHFSHIETSDTDLINEAIMERLLDAPVVTVSTVSNAR